MGGDVERDDHDANKQVSRERERSSGGDRR